MLQNGMSVYENPYNLLSISNHDRSSITILLDIQSYIFVHEQFGRRTYNGSSSPWWRKRRALCMSFSLLVLEFPSLSPLC